MKFDSINDNLSKMAEELKSSLTNLLLNHTKIYRWDTGHSDMVTVITTTPYAFREVNEEGRRIQAKLLEEYRLFHSIITGLLREQPSDTKRELERTDNIIISTIELRTTHCKNQEQALDLVSKAIDEQVGFLNRVYDDSAGEPTFVPDTNALLSNTTLESWAFEGIDRFNIILVPTVLKELD